MKATCWKSGLSGTGLREKMKKEKRKRINYGIHASLKAALLKL